MSTGRRILTGVTAALSAGVLLVSGIGWWGTNHYLNDIVKVQVFAPAANRPTVDPRAGDSMNILLVGSDNRDGLTRAQRAQLHLGQGDYGISTDTMMIIHIGQDTSHVTVVGLPRDSLVTIPDCVDTSGKTVPEHQSRINTAFAEGGGKCMVATVEQATNIHIDHYVEVSFTAFLDMVNAVDGVDVCLATPLKDNPKYTSLDLPAGRSTITGVMALNFMRARHVDDDFGRIRRQQQFIASMLHKAMSAGVLLNPLKLNAFISAALSHTKVDETLDRDAILNLAGRLQGIDFSHIEFPRIPIENAGYTIPGTNRGGFVKWDDAGATQLFDEIRADQPITPEAAGKVAAPTVAANQITIAVYNGTSITGLGAKAATALGKLGFSVDSPATSSSKPVTRTVIRYDSTYTESVKTLAAALPHALLRPVAGLGSTLQVIVGPDYVAPVAPAVVAPTTGTIKASTGADLICPS